MADRPDGVIRDENEELRYDAGEAAKDQYERADAVEKDVIEVRGIVFFGLGLFLMCVVAFFLMWLLQVAMEDQARQAYAKEKSPMALSKDEALPPEPRLQAAPGFQVLDKNGNPVILELREPQAEYRELRKVWEDQWKNGIKDKQSGTVTALPINQAKDLVVTQNLIKTRAEQETKKADAEVRMIPSYQSAGRTNEIRRQ